MPMNANFGVAHTHVGQQGRVGAIIERGGWITSYQTLGAG